MKKTLLAFSVILLVFLSAGAQKKLSKEEIKSIKKELKNYKKNPNQYLSMKRRQRNMIAERDSIIDSLRVGLDDALLRMYEKEANATALQKEIAKLESKITQLQEEAENNVYDSAPTTDTIYKVQIGIGRDRNLAEYFSVPKLVGTDKVSEGINAFVISHFTTREEAELFKAHIRRFGVHDAFVSKYVNGVRIYEWDKNPKYKGRKQPPTIEEIIK